MVRLSKRGFVLSVISWSKRFLSELLIVIQLNSLPILNVINPVFAAVTAFNRIAKVEIIDHLSFVNAVTNYQQQRRYFIIDYQLTRKKFGLEEFLSFPKFKFNPPMLSFTDVVLIMLPLFLWTIILILAAYRKTSKI